MYMHNTGRINKFDSVWKTNCIWGRDWVAVVRISEVTAS